MQDSSHRNRTSAASRTVPSFISTKGRRQFLAFVCTLAGVAVGAAAAISTSVYMRRAQKGKDVTPFCCPGLARELAWYINDSINPCQDFFAYVCFNVFRDGQRQEYDLEAQLTQSLITGASSKAMPRGDAARFLTSFYRSCVEVLPNPKSFYQSLARAVVDNLWGRQEPVDTRKAIMYIFAASLTYDMPSAVSVSIGENKSTVVIKIKEICNMSTHDYGAMTAVVNALNEGANATTVSSESAFRFWGKLCEEFLSARRKIRQYWTNNGSHQIQAELWNTDDLDAVLGVYGSSLLRARSVSAVGVRQIRLIHDKFASEQKNTTAAATKVAFLVWHSLVHTTEDLYTSNFPLQLLFKICLGNALQMHEVWDRYAAEMLTTREKDAVAQAVFAAVKRSVYADIRTNLLLNADDAERLSGFIENLVLVTPIEASHISIPVPNATEDLGKNYLKGHFYGFLVEREREANLTDVRKVDYNEVQFLGERQLLLSSRIYGYISAGSGDYELPNNARLGRLLAEAIWYMALAKIEWTSKTRANINRFKKCFAENYLGNRKSDVTERFIVTVLGLSSVVNALNKSDWQTLKLAWSLWRISNAQFFFMLSTYYRCPWLWFPKTARLTNLSLLYNEDFTAAFRCPYNAPIMKTRQCFVNGSHALKK